MGIINNGVKQWVFQRIANALIVSFGICLLCIFMSPSGLTYDSLQALLAGSVFKIYITVLLVVSCLNAVLAGWQIDGDYAKKFGLPAQLLTTIAAIVSAAYLIYGLSLLYV